SILDGIVGMEGEGPAAGRVVNTGIVAASADGVSLDAVISKIAGVPASKDIIVNEARRRNAGEADLNKIEVLGEPIEAVKFKKFRLPVTASAVSALPDFIMDFMRGILNFRPFIYEKACVKCGICKTACPVDAITISKTESRIYDNICIRCFCCHEMCPHKAIYIKKGLLTRLLWRS
ncbi:MAG: 4Fe-4S binding protein, partial [Candidatus Omnitrophica bacterium]|nr:4Fe-4S binding protein [Candidatus Omnitrophota bacterium]